MATPPGGGEEVPQAGYYPDPSIPGYIRFWNGAAWVPGTSRPAPKEGEATPNPPASATPAGPMPTPSPAPAPAPAPTPAPAPAQAQASAPAPGPSAAAGAFAPLSLRRDPAVAAAAVEETGPVFFDEEEAAAQEPASAWQADTSRQGGFGGERDQKVSWGAPEPRAEAAAAPSRAPQAAPAPEAPVRTAPAVPDPRTPAEWPVAGGSEPAPAPAAPADPRGTAGAARLGGMPVTPIATPAPTPAPAPPVPTPAPAPAPAPVQPQQAQPAPAPVPAPVQPAPAPAPTPAPGPSWAQRPAPQEQEQQPVVPWKPPVDDPFLAAAREQASARPAGLGRRLVARLIDTLVLGALVGGASFPFVTAALEHIDGKIEAARQSGVTVQVWLVDSTTSVQFGLALAAFLVLGLLYEALPTAKWGRTLGKKLCGVQVRDIEAHEPPTFGRSLRRWLAYTFLGLLVIGVLNVLWCVFDRPWRQCWHDKAARTFVAR
ncbi:RDD family protein [Streptomyces sp. NPDC003327]